MTRSKEQSTAKSIELAEEQIVEQSKRIEFYLTEYSVEMLAQKIHDDEYVVPPYQREFTWEERRKSRFIESAVAVPRYNKDHKVQNLLAYVILKDGVREQFERDIDITKAIKEDLADIMMSYMMPSKFLYRDSLPLTPNGKIDIKGLINEVNSR